MSDEVRIIFAVTLAVALPVTCPTMQTLHEVLRISAGDLRKAITFLQSASDLYGRKVSPANIVEISGVFPDKLLGDTVRCIKTSGFEGVRLACFLQSSHRSYWLHV